MSRLRGKGKGFLGKRVKNRVLDQYDGGLARPSEGFVFEDGRQSLCCLALGLAAEDGPCEEEEADGVGWRSSSS